MAKRSTSSNTSKRDAADLQELVTGAAQLQLSVFNAGVEYWKAVVNQAGKLTSIASDTLEEIRGDEGSVSNTTRNTTRKLAELGKENAQVFGELSTRLGQDYFDELKRVTDAVTTKKGKRPPVAKPTPRPAAKKRAPTASRTSSTRRRTTAR